VPYIPVGKCIPTNKNIKIEENLIDGIKSYGMLASEEELKISYRKLK